jgi:holo-[acyl-carrier protein] synthase
MIIGIGTDLVEVRRIQQSLDKFGERFVKKVLTAEELQQFAEAKFPGSFLAKRFAAKEAVAKVLGTGMRAGVHFTNIAVTHDAAGKPMVCLSAAAQTRAAQLGVDHWHLSITDERQFALAFAVAEKDR